jgi:uncharacterized protein YpmB
VDHAASQHMVKPVLRIIGILLILYVVVVAIVYFRQRSMLYFPTHATPATGLIKFT